ncbi:MAG: CHASE2 domain-containing protein [Symploca sp. SIO1C2]|nr:CHASE2 domain-containing protein [Symploca sp. SIO1C2]
MGKSVNLKIVNGDFDQGFQVILRIGEDGSSTATEINGWLPPAPQLPWLCSNWYSSYHSGGETEASRALTAPETQVTNFSILDSAQDLENAINNWLNASDLQFRFFRDKLLKYLQSNEPIRFIIQTDNIELWQLPWHLWDVFQELKVEVSISPSEYEIDFTPGAKTSNQVRILVILGNNSGIDIEKDLASLQQELANAYLRILRNPQKSALSSELWEQEWDILFFAGHSSTQDDLQGRFGINQQESLTIEELKFALTDAIEHGLKLAIFNSCNGLGLARELASLQIPATMVMREKVPNEVAQKFLLYFLKAFANKGKSLSGAVWEARTRLQELEKEYPCASWLPMVCQNPAQVPPTWEELQKQTQHKSPSWPRLPLLQVFLVSLIVTGLVMGMRSLGFWQFWELKVFDQMIRLLPAEKPDERLLIVEVTKKDIEQLQDSYPLSDGMMLQLLKKLGEHQPQIIGLDIYRDLPQGQGRDDLVQYLQQHPHVISPCAHSGSTYPGIHPPPGLSSQQVGFVDTVKDPDQIIRRHLLVVDPPSQSPCTAIYALSTQLALYYLEAKGYSLDFPTPESWQIGSLRFKILKAQPGFYQQSKLLRGHQILLNYRAYNSLEDIAQRVTLTQVLTNQVEPHLISDRIILIGVTDPTLAKDEFNTPYHQEIRGLLLHAQMVSQFVSAVEEQRRLWQFLTLWGDLLWVGSWSLLGGIIVWRFRSFLNQGIVAGVACICLCSSCWIILSTKGVVVPLVPSALTLVITGSIVAVKNFTMYHKQRSRG